MTSRRLQTFPIPDSIANMTFWRYGTSLHSNEAGKILGPVIITVKNDQGHSVYLLHLVIYDYSQFMIGRNVTKNCDIILARKFAQATRWKWHYYFG